MASSEEKEKTSGDVSTRQNVAGKREGSPTIVHVDEDFPGAGGQAGQGLVALGVQPIMERRPDFLLVLWRLRGWRVGKKGVCGGGGGQTVWG